MPSVTKTDWREFQAVLLSVPLGARTPAWKRVCGIVRDIIDGRNNLSPDCYLDTLRYAVNCSLCGKEITLEDDYVFKALTGEFRHYDCLYREHFISPGA